jgi:secreted trypsin-like serine protease
MTATDQRPLAPNGGQRRRALRAVMGMGVVLAAALAPGSPAAAVTGGEPDNGRHPQVAFIMAELPDGITFCTGTLISPTVVLTAAHCTSFWDDLDVAEVQVSFDDHVTGGGIFYTSTKWRTHPGYSDSAWPFTVDIGVVILPQAVGYAPASLAEEGQLDTIIPEAGAANNQKFVDVGYGQTGVTTGGGPPQASFPLQRRLSIQTYHPGGNDLVGVIHGMGPQLLMLKANPSSRHGSGCGGDSGGPIFLNGTYTIVAIHTGGYRLGFDGQLCGRLSSLNHRVDTAEVLDWLDKFI